MQKIIRQIASEIKVQEHQVKTAVELLDGGATVPFIARYRKEATGGLDDIQLRELEHRLVYLRELEERLASPDLYKEGDKVKQTTKEFEEIKIELARLYEHWEEAVELN